MNFREWNGSGLPPCPACGGRVIIRRLHSEMFPCAIVKCRGCSYSIQHPRKEDAIRIHEEAVKVCQK